MKSVHNFTFLNYFDVLLPNFILPMLYFALSILNISFPTVYFVLPEHNIGVSILYFVLPILNNIRFYRLILVIQTVFVYMELCDY